MNLEVALIYGIVTAFAQILLAVVFEGQHITLHRVNEKAAIGAQRQRSSYVCLLFERLNFELLLLFHSLVV